MVRVRLAVLVIGAVAMLSAAALGRTWTDSTGKYTVDASLLAFNDKHVVLERDDRQLVAVPIDKLSQADRDYLDSPEASEAASGLTGAMQTWTLADGTQLVGRVVDYAHKDVTLQRRRSRIYVNDRLFDNLPEVYQRIVPLIVSHFDRLNNPTRRGLESWLVRQRGEPRTFTIDGVVLEVENGDEYIVPFFLFSDDDLAVLKPGWDHWLAHQQDYNLHEDNAFRLQSLAAAYKRDRQVQRQIQLMQLHLQAVQAGLTSVWEVALVPARPNAGPSLSVVVYGRNSRDAVNAALAQNPGYTAGPVRRVSG